MLKKNGQTDMKHIYSNSFFSYLSMINLSKPSLTRFKILHFSDERYVILQVDYFPFNVRIGDEFYVSNGNSLILCKVRKLWNYSFQPQTHIFKNEYGYVEIEVLSHRQISTFIEQDVFSNPVQTAYTNVLSKFKDEVKRLRQRGKNYSSEKLASEIRNIASKYRNLLKTEINREVSNFNSKSEKKLVGDDLRKRVEAAMKSFDDVIKDSILSVAEKTNNKYYS